MTKKQKMREELLRHYFQIEGKQAKLKLVYDTFSELVNPNFGDDKIEKLNDKLFSDVHDAVSLLPRKYKLNLQIEIKDFGSYNLEECENIIKQNIALAGYRVLKGNNKKRITGWSLIGVGAVILVISYFLHNYNLWFDLVNISGTLFVWEGVSTAFIERNHDNKELITLVKAIQNITIVSPESEKKSKKTSKIHKKN